MTNNANQIWHPRRRYKLLCSLLRDQLSLALYGAQKVPGDAPPRRATGSFLEAVWS
jgi:hypothetical protein